MNITVYFRRSVDYIKAFIQKEWPGLKSRAQKLSLAFSEAVSGNPKLKKMAGRTAMGIMVLFSLLLLAAFLLYFVPFAQSLAQPARFNSEASNETNEQAYNKQLQQLSREVGKLKTRYSSLTPGQSYMVINTTDNKFYLSRRMRAAAPRTVA